MRRETAILTLVVSLTIIATSAIIARGGPLDPPGGPVQPTYKTLDQAEPRILINSQNTPGDADSLYRISQPGSYYFDRTIIGVAAKHGIEIASHDVSIDLNGFKLVGVLNSLSGISTDSSRSWITIRNGHIRSWGASGIDLSRGGLGESSLVDQIQAASNGASGIIGNENGILRDCSATSNNAAGFNAPTGSNVEGCTAADNFVGFSVGESSSIRACNARNNGGTGINLGNASIAEHCVLTGNQNHGILAGAGCIITACTSRGNAGDGFQLGAASTIDACVSSSNTEDGIQLGSYSVARANNCDSNTTGSGVRSAGNNTRIEANNATRNLFGINGTKVNDIVVANSASGNTQNWNAGQFAGWGRIMTAIQGDSPATPGFFNTEYAWGNLATDF